MTPAHDWRERRLAPEVWLLFERDLGSTPRVKAHLVDLPATATLPLLVRLAHHRWAIEQQYEELKNELGLDHFEGRSFVGWHRHVVLTAMALCVAAGRTAARRDLEATLVAKYMVMGPPIMDQVQDRLHYGRQFTIRNLPMTLECRSIIDSRKHCLSGVSHSAND